MAKPEKRKFIRHEALHLLDYLVIDSDGNPGNYSMGRTLDVSIDGLKLETVQQFPPGTQLLITLGLQDDLVDLHGKITHCEPHMGRHASGITFARITKSGRKTLARYVEAFNRRKKELQKEEAAGKG